MIKTSKVTDKKKSAKNGTTATAAAKAAPAAVAEKAAPAAAAKSAAPVIAEMPGVRLELVLPGAKSVAVAGSFNAWKPETTPLQPSGNGRWTGSLKVNPGRYEYLFVVDGQWLPDPNAKEAVQNPYGGCNSVLVVNA